MKRWIFFFALLCAYAAVVIPVKSYMDERPVAVKLGYVPEGRVLKYTVGDQKNLVAELSVLKVLFYFGSLVEKWQNQVAVPPEYFNMYRMIESAALLDPYNMDTYYFAQAAFTWEVGHAEDVNRLLDHGMTYRSWDWYLPYFAGFNAAYFLKDYDSASRYMRRAAEISGNSLFTTLAARYFYESGHNELGVVFLQRMMEKEQDPKVRQVFKLRLEALQATLVLEEALDNFVQQYGRIPSSLEELVSVGLLDEVPADPYGGEFYLDTIGKIRATSSFALPRPQQQDGT